MHSMPEVLDIKYRNRFVIIYYASSTIFPLLSQIGMRNKPRKINTHKTGAHMVLNFAICKSNFQEKLWSVKYALKDKLSRARTVAHWNVTIDYL